MDHNVSTRSLAIDACGPESATQMRTLARNCAEFGVQLYAIGDINQGIVHVMGPEQGITLPGTTIVCGDSHTACHGGLGALAMPRRGDPRLGAYVSAAVCTPETARLAAISPVVGGLKAP